VLFRSLYPEQALALRLSNQFVYVREAEFLLVGCRFRRPQELLEGPKVHGPMDAALPAGENLVKQSNGLFSPNRLPDVGGSLGFWLGLEQRLRRRGDLRVGRRRHVLRCRARDLARRRCADMCALC